MAPPDEPPRKLLDNPRRWASSALLFSVSFLGLVTLVRGASLGHGVAVALEARFPWWKQFCQTCSTARWSAGLYEPTLDPIVAKVAMLIGLISMPLLALVAAYAIAAAQRAWWNSKAIASDNEAALALQAIAAKVLTNAFRKAPTLVVVAGDRSPFVCGTPSHSLLVVAEKWLTKKSDIARAFAALHETAHILAGDLFFVYLTHSLTVLVVLLTLGQSLLGRFFFGPDLVADAAAQGLEVGFRPMVNSLLLLGAQLLVGFLLHLRAMRAREIEGDVFAATVLHLNANGLADPYRGEHETLSAELVKEAAREALAGGEPLSLSAWVKRVLMPSLHMDAGEGLRPLQKFWSLRVAYPFRKMASIFASHPSDDERCVRIEEVLCRLQKEGPKAAEEALNQDRSWDTFALIGVAFGLSFLALSSLHEFVERLADHDVNSATWNTLPGSDRLSQWVFVLSSWLGSASAFLWHTAFCFALLPLRRLPLREGARGMLDTTSLVLGFFSIVVLHAAASSAERRFLLLVHCVGLGSIVYLGAWLPRAFSKKSEPPTAAQDMFVAVADAASFALLGPTLLAALKPTIGATKLPILAPFSPLWLLLPLLGIVVAYGAASLPFRSARLRAWAGEGSRGSPALALLLVAPLSLGIPWYKALLLTPLSAGLREQARRLRLDPGDPHKDPKILREDKEQMFQKLLVAGELLRVPVADELMAWGIEQQRGLLRNPRYRAALAPVEAWPVHLRPSALDGELLAIRRTNVQTRKSPRARVEAALALALSEPSLWGRLDALSLAVETLGPQCASLPAFERLAEQLMTESATDKRLSDEVLALAIRVHLEAIVTGKPTLLSALSGRVKDSRRGLEEAMLRQGLRFLQSYAGEGAEAALFVAQIGLIAGTQPLSSAGQCRRQLLRAFVGFLADPQGAPPERPALPDASQKPLQIDPWWKGCDPGDPKAGERGLLEDHELALSLDLRSALGVMPDERVIRHAGSIMRTHQAIHFIYYNLASASFEDHRNQKVTNFIHDAECAKVVLTQRSNQGYGFLPGDLPGDHGLNLLVIERNFLTRLFKYGGEIYPTVGDILQDFANILYYRFDTKSFRAEDEDSRGELVLVFAAVGCFLDDKWCNARLLDVPLREALHRAVEKRAVEGSFYQGMLSYLVARIEADGSGNPADRGRLDSLLFAAQQPPAKCEHQDPTTRAFVRLKNARMAFHTMNRNYILPNSSCSPGKKSPSTSPWVSCWDGAAQLYEDALNHEAMLPVHQPVGRINDVIRACSMDGYTALSVMNDMDARKLIEEDAKDEAKNKREHEFMKKAHAGIAADWANFGTGFFWGEVKSPHDLAQLTTTLPFARWQMPDLRLKIVDRYFTAAISGAPLDPRDDALVETLLRQGLPLLFCETALEESLLTRPTEESVRPITIERFKRWCSPRLAKPGEVPTDVLSFLLEEALPCREEANDDACERIKQRTKRPLWMSEQRYAKVKASVLPPRARNSTSP